MKRLREKWRDRSGASILLALLFLLACMTAAATVLTAAASNAGKSRSGYEEQQKYLALSSALRLAAGQIEAAEYRGAYTVQRWTVPVCDDEGNRVGETNYYHVRQTGGSFSCGLLGGVLDCTGELDGLFAEAFTGPGRTPLSGADTAPLPSVSVLTVKAEGGGEAGEEPSEPGARERFPDITIEATLRRDLRVHLTARLEEAEGRVYRMEAELAASGLPVLDFTPNPDEFAAEGPGGTAENLSSTPRDPPLEPDVTWKLDWIAREAAGE